MKRIEAEHWQCSTSRFTALEILDTEQAEKSIENLSANGMSLSKIRGFLRNRRQLDQRLKRRELNQIHTKLYDELSEKLTFITFVHPLTEEF